MAWLDKEGFDTVDGFIPMREANGGILGITSIGNKHQIHVYSTKTHRQHVLAGENNYSSEDAARSIIDAHDRSIKSSMFEDNSAPISAREAERYEARAKEREAEARTSNHSAFTDY